MLCNWLADPLTIKNILLRADPTTRTERKETGVDAVDRFFILFENTLTNAPILKNNAVDLFEFNNIKLFRNGITLPTTPTEGSTSEIELVFVKDKEKEI